MMIMESKKEPTLFPEQLYDMLEEAEDMSFDHIISWLPSGNAFKIHRPKSFAKHILPRYFSRQTRYKSFSRQLNLYNFRYVKRAEFEACDQDNVGGFIHPMFQRGKRDRCCYISRKKQSPRKRHPTTDKDSASSCHAVVAESTQSIAMISPDCGDPSLPTANGDQVPFLQEEMEEETMTGSSSQEGGLLLSSGSGCAPPGDPVLEETGESIPLFSYTGERKEATNIFSSSQQEHIMASISSLSPPQCLLAKTDWFQHHEVCLLAFAREASVAILNRNNKNFKGDPVVHLEGSSLTTCRGNVASISSYW